MKFRPLHDRVVLRRIEEDERTKGGIIIPDTAKEKPQQGEVVAVGPGARDEKGVVQPLDVKAGDRVLFGKWSGTEVKIDDEELLIMKESDILGVLEGAAAKEEGRLKRQTTLAIWSNSHGCERSEIFPRRPRPHAAGHRHLDQCSQGDARA